MTAGGRRAPDPSGHDPFAVLGLPPSASAADVRTARRRLAKAHHPDVGGDPAQMRSVNAAVAAALVAIDERVRDQVRGGPGAGASGAAAATGSRAGTTASPGPPPSETGVDGRPIVRDQASFTIEALPAAAFEALLVVASWIGEVLVDDPPYLLEVHLHDPAEWWCRLELVPDAGAATVALTVAAVSPGPAPDVDLVRDVWVAELNRLDWSELT